MVYSYKSDYDMSDNLSFILGTQVQKVRYGGTHL